MVVSFLSKIVHHLPHCFVWKINESQFQSCILYSVKWSQQFHEGAYHIGLLLEFTILSPEQILCGGVTPETGLLLRVKLSLRAESTKAVKDNPNSCELQWDGTFGNYLNLSLVVVNLSLQYTYMNILVAFEKKQIDCFFFSSKHESVGSS